MNGSEGKRHAIHSFGYNDQGHGEFERPVLAHNGQPDVARRARSLGQLFQVGIPGEPPAVQTNNDISLPDAGIPQTCVVSYVKNGESI